MKAHVHSTFNITHNASDEVEVRFPRIMHVEADLLNSVGEVGPSQRVVLQDASQTTVHGVSNGVAGSRTQLGPRVNRSHRGVALRHASPTAYCLCDRSKPSEERVTEMPRK